MAGQARLRTVCRSQAFYQVHLPLQCHLLEDRTRAFGTKLEDVSQDFQVMSLNRG